VVQCLWYQIFKEAPNQHILSQMTAVDLLFSLMKVESLWNRSTGLLLGSVWPIRWTRKSWLKRVFFISVETHWRCISNSIPFILRGNNWELVLFWSMVDKADLLNAASTWALAKQISWRTDRKIATSLWSSLTQLCAFEQPLSLRETPGVKPFLPSLAQDY